MSGDDAGMDDLIHLAASALAITPHSTTEKSATGRPEQSASARFRSEPRETLRQWQRLRGGGFTARLSLRAAGKGVWRLHPPIISLATWAMSCLYDSK
jgi:hypothetical protein